LQLLESYAVMILICVLEKDSYAGGERLFPSLLAHQLTNIMLSFTLSGIYCGQSIGSLYFYQALTRNSG